MSGRRRAPHPVLAWARAVGGWLVLLVVAAFVAATVAVPRLTGGTAYTVTSGSMRPTLPPGTLIVTRPADPTALGIGDVITYQAVSGQPAVVTHRIIGVGYAAGGETTFRTRGDANDTADARPVRAVQVRGELWYALPWAGYLNTWVNGRHRSVLVYAVSALLLGYAGWMFVSAARDRRPLPRRARRPGVAS
jgi:signal peptidase I